MITDNLNFNLKKNNLLYYSLLFLLFVKVCHAQINDSIIKHESERYVKLHVVLNLNTIPLSGIQPLLKRKQIFAVKFSEIRDVNTSFIKQYKTFNDSLIVISENTIKGYNVKDLVLIYRKPSNMESIKLAKRKIFDSILPRFKEPDKHKNVIIEDDFELTDSLFFEIWRQSGEVPNFIESNEISLFKTDSIVSVFNSLRKVFGVVKTEKGELIKDVRFKGYEESIVDGHFSFPILKGERLPILIPYKPGYHFSPDIIYTTPENYDNSKEFSAFKMNLEFGLTHYFVFDPSFKNEIKKNDKELLLNNVEVYKDSTRGKVGYFNNRSYIDTGIDSRNSLQKSFTIAAWIKPTALDLNNSILGKGENFVVKLHNGFLTFTMAGVKDYISKASSIPLNRWTHIALVHSKVDNKLGFYVNGELKEEVKLVAEYVTSDYNILIGSNLWEEFFYGYLADIKIWERELNGNEIVTLFEASEKHTHVGSLAIGITVLIALLLTLLFLYRKYRPKRRNVLITKKNDAVRKKQITVPKGHKADDLESILCFGKLRIINNEGEDIAENLSPLLKKIFVIVFLYSHQGNKKGISTKQLTEFLWPGMSSQKAKNTRGTNINNLRAILNSCSNINLVFKNKSWFIELNENGFCDYLVVQQYLNAFLTNDFSIRELEQELPKFLEILSGGRLFSSSSEPWLDPFIEKFSNQIIEQCLEFTELLEIEKHSELLLLLTDVICVYDDLNEKSHQLKLQALIKQGKLSLAYKAHDNFVKLYYKIYKEDYAISFEDITSENN